MKGTRRERIERAKNAGNRAYYDWVGRMMTLSAGALTVLVTFQDQLAGTRPRCLWLLQACWIFLALSVSAAALALQGRHQTAWDRAQALNSRPRQTTPVHRMEALDIQTAPRRTARFAGESLSTILALAVAFLTTFAVLNIGHR
jgi:hypothetical protein